MECLRKGSINFSVYCWPNLCVRTLELFPDWSVKATDLRSLIPWHSSNPSLCSWWTIKYMESQNKIFNHHFYDCSETSDEILMKLAWTLSIARRTNIKEENNDIHHEQNWLLMWNSLALWYYLLFRLYENSSLSFLTTSKQCPELFFRKSFRENFPFVWGVVITS